MIPELEKTLNAFERSMTGTDALDKEVASHVAARLALYRALIAAIERLSSESLNTAEDERRTLSGATFFQTPEARTN